MSQLLLPLLLMLVMLIGVHPAGAAELKLDHLTLEPCSVEDPGNQPDFARPMGATCYVLSGEVENPGRNAVVDTDVFARIMDSSGEPILPNRTRVGSIGDIGPGVQAFALRLSVPAGTPGPFEIRNPSARGFKTPVRNLASVEDDDLLPLEQAIQ